MDTPTAEDQNVRRAGTFYDEMMNRAEFYQKCNALSSFLQSTIYSLLGKYYYMGIFWKILKAVAFL